MATKEPKTIEVQPINVETVEITIKGDSDLILNKMTDTAAQEIIKDQTGENDKSVKKKKDPINKWQRLVEGIHWMDGPETDFTEEGWKNALEHNRVGYDASGIKKGICEAVVRVLGKSKSTVENANIQIVPEKKNLVQIKFDDIAIDESIIPGFKGTFLAYRNVLSGWESTFKVKYIADNITINQLIEMFQYMGFAGGLGAHRVGLKGGTNGQFHVAKVVQVA